MFSLVITLQHTFFSSTCNDFPGLELLFDLIVINRDNGFTTFTVNE